MGAAISLLQRQSHLIQLMHTIHKNDIKLLKRRIKYAVSKDIKELFVEAIRRERKQFFDFLLEYTLTDLVNHIESGYYECYFEASINCPDPYYAMKLLEVYEFIPISKIPKLTKLLERAVHLENEFIAHQLIIRGTDVNTLDDLTQSPLDDAIKCNNMNLITMLLYYGSYTHLPDNLTSFMNSMINECPEEIQRLMMEYEADFNLICDGNSTLFYAIKYKSPVILDIIERGANINYNDGIHNAISLALLYDCDASIFKILWEKFDYSVWRDSFNKSVLIMFLQSDVGITEWLEYLTIFMENEAKLLSDIEYHNNSHFYKSDPLISIFYQRCLEKNLDSNITENLIFHLLVHGAQIFIKDIDTICRKLGYMTPFLESLLYMDLQTSDDESSSIMYFKYTPIPDLNLFLTNAVVPSNVLLNYLKYLARYYAFDGFLKTRILDILGSEDENFAACEKVFNECVTFPSLLELSRNSARQYICLKYFINNSCKLHTIIKHLGLPRYIEYILLFDVCLYCFPI